MKPVTLMIALCFFVHANLHAQVSGKKPAAGVTNDPNLTTTPKTEKAENKCCDTNGDIQVRKKLTRWIAPEDNFLPIAAGTVSSDATSIWISPLANSSVERVSAGKYKITIGNARISLRSSIIVTPQTTSPRICTSKFISASVFEVYVFTLNGDPVDCAFSFIINDPMNLFN